MTHGHRLSEEERGVFVGRGGGQTRIDRQGAQHDLHFGQFGPVGDFVTVPPVESAEQGERPGGKEQEADGGTRREQMMEAVNLSKDLAVAYGCPVLLGVQASRETLERDDKVPTIQDGQETSNIEQSADVAFGCWYPIKTEKPNAAINGYAVTKNLFVLRLLKQKLGPAPETFMTYVDPERRTFAPLTKDVNHV